jgi:hypothetical protein
MRMSEADAIMPEDIARRNREMRVDDRRFGSDGNWLGRQTKRSAASLAPRCASHVERTMLWPTEVDLGAQD